MNTFEALETRFREPESTFFASKVETTGTEQTRLESQTWGRGEIVVEQAGEGAIKTAMRLEVGMDQLVQLREDSDRHHWPWLLEFVVGRDGVASLVWGIHRPLGRWKDSARSQRLRE